VVRGLPGQGKEESGRRLLVCLEVGLGNSKLGKEECYGRESFQSVDEKCWGRGGDRQLSPFRGKKKKTGYVSRDVHKRGGCSPGGGGDSIGKKETAPPTGRKEDEPTKVKFDGNLTNGTAKPTNSRSGTGLLIRKREGRKKVKTYAKSNTCVDEINQSPGGQGMNVQREDGHYKT